MPDTSEQGKYITYEELDDGAIVRILLNRPNTRNAQNRGLLVELDEAFHRAEQDDKVRVVILGGVGPLFSSGHDMGSKESQAERAPELHPSRGLDGTYLGGEVMHLLFQPASPFRALITASSAASSKVTAADNSSPFA